jgi:hypothetical protein
LNGGIVCKIRALVKAGKISNSTKVLNLYPVFYFHDEAFGDQEALGFRIFCSVGLDDHMTQKPGIIIFRRHGDDVTGFPDKPGFFNPHLIPQRLGTQSLKPAALMGMDPDPDVGTKTSRSVNAYRLFFRKIQGKLENIQVPGFQQK